MRSKMQIDREHLGQGNYLYQSKEVSDIRLTRRHKVQRSINPYTGVRRFYREYQYHLGRLWYVRS